jgi:ribonuclease HI
MDSLTTFQTQGFTTTAATSPTLATDGSGGPAYQAHSRRVTAAVAAVNFDAAGLEVRDVHFQASDIPGRQTVPRAELFALILAKSAASTSSPTKVQCDSAYSVKGAQAYDTERLNSSYNGDLWAKYASIANSTVRVDKVPAHAEKQTLAGHLPAASYIRNAVADAAADAAADLLADRAEAEAEELWQARAFLVAHRLAILEAEVRAETPLATLLPVPVPPPSPAPRNRRAELVTTVAGQGQRIRRTGTFLRCVRCQLWRSRLGACARQPCLPTRVAAAATTSPPPTPQPEPAFEWQLLTFAQRKRKLEALRSHTRAAKKQAKADERQADLDHTRATTHEASDAEDGLIITDEPVEVPFVICPSHRVLHYRGYAACIRCGTMASTATRRGKHFAQPCLGHGACS